MLNLLTNNPTGPFRLIVVNITLDFGVHLWYGVSVRLGMA